MAERRMFAKTIIDSDAFLDMPLSTQALYFHLSMRADDDGFINSPKKVQRMVGCGDDDLKLLIAKNFLIPFESGVVVIKHWKIHNYIRNDRYKPTVYKEEKSQLYLKENNSYTLDKTLGIPSDNQVVYQMEPQVRDRIELGKDSIVEDNSKKERNSYKQIINEYTDDEETEKAIFEFIQFFQAKQGCYILDKQLRQFLDNCEHFGLLFDGGVRSCIRGESIDFALMDKTYL
jgi:hypothetical protein